MATKISIKRVNVYLGNPEFINEGEGRVETGMRDTGAEEECNQPDDPRGDGGPGGAMRAIFATILGGNCEHKRKLDYLQAVIEEVKDPHDAYILLKLFILEEMETIADILAKKSEEGGIKTEEARQVLGQIYKDQLKAQKQQS